MIEVGMMLKPILKYPGAKWLLAPKIIPYFPEHEVYVEPYCGSAAVFFTKKPSELEILNDLSSQIVQFFRILRERGEELAKQVSLTPWSREEYELSYEPTEDELENARRFVVRCWQAHGTLMAHRTGWKNTGKMERGGNKCTHLWEKIPDRLLAVIDRLKDAEIEHRPALEVIQRHNTPHTLLYVDPPYVEATRRKNIYAHEMTDSDHLALLEALNKHQGSVILSGYNHPLYEQHLTMWDKVIIPLLIEKGNIREEVLWLNPQACKSRQLSFDFEIA